MRLACAVVVLVVGCASAARAAGDEFNFVGPAPVRNFAPIQLIFLNLPFQRALVTPERELAFHLWTAESNEIATTQGRFESTLKFETNWTAFGVQYGFAPDWEIGMDVPFISRWGGFLDPMINEIERLTGQVNPERNLFPNNTFGAFSVKEGNTTVFHGRPEAFELGDMWTSMKRQFQFGDGWPRLALRGAFKMPTGNPDQVNGSGKPDFGLGGALDYRVFDRLMLYMNVNVIFPVGPITPADLTLNPFVTESFAGEFALLRWLTVQLHQATYTSPIADTGTALMGDPVVELGLGFNAHCASWLDLQIMGIDNVSGVEQAADFTLLFAARVTVGSRQ